MNNANNTCQTAPCMAEIAKQVVGDHPSQMSHLLLWQFLLGNRDFGRMASKGLDRSRWFGCFAGHDPEMVDDVVMGLFESGAIVEGGKAYPGLHLPG